MRACLVLAVVMSWLAVPAAEDGSARAPVPLSIDRHGSIQVGVEVNGAGPFPFLLDTGAARSIISADLARQLSAPAVGRSEIVTSAGSEIGMVVRLASVALASSRVGDLLAPVVDQEQLSQLAPGVRGLLGQDFLSAFNYTLDYRRGRLTWEPQVSCTEDAAVRLAKAEGRFVMGARDERGDDWRLVPDSGAEIAVLFRAPSAPSEGEAGVTSLVSGMRRVARVTLPALRIGRAQMRDVAAVVAERDDTGADGLLPLHTFASVTFAAGGSCIVPRLR